MFHVPEWCRDYVGVPYVEGGRDVVVDGGLDCWGLVVVVLRQVFGVRVEQAYHGPAWAKLGANHKTMREAIARAMLTAAARYPTVPPGFERAGDMAIFRVAGEPLHVGLVLAPGVMLHTEAAAGASVIERYDTDRWRTRLIEIKRDRAQAAEVQHD